MWSLKMGKNKNSGDAKNITRTRMGRILLLDREIKSGKYPSCTSFAKYLAEKRGMKEAFDRKTILRDIEFMREELYAPIEYDSSKKGYYYPSNKTWAFPMLTLTEGELVQLLLAEEMAKAFEGTPIAKTLDGIFEKFLFSLQDEVDIDPIIARQQFSFHGHPVRKIKQDVWSTVFKALRNQQVIKIKYKGIQDNKVKSRDVEPVHLGCVDSEWYLVAHCRLRDELRHFAMSRIESVKLIEDYFILPDFDPDVYFSNRFGRYIGKPGEEQWVKIKFKPSAVPWVLEREWHHKQKIQKHKDGSLTLSFPAPSMYEVERWVRQWGDEAEIVMSDRQNG